MPRYSRAFDGERRTEVITLKATPSERATLDAAAKAQRTTRSMFARELLFRRTAAVVATTRRNPEADALLTRLDTLGAEISRVGNNLNQIARELNTTGEMRTPEALDQALEDYEQIGGLLRQAVEKVITL